MALKDASIVTFDSEELLHFAPEVRAFLNEAYEGDFSDSDFANALGGQHFARFESGRLIAHASVVDRSISLDDTLFRVAYVEAVAVAVDCRGRRLGQQIVQFVTDFCRSNYLAAMLSRDEHAFYERFGWVRLEAASHVETASGLIRTRDEDESLMLLTDIPEISHPRRVVAHDRVESPW